MVIQMKRLIYQNLLEWKKNTNKKPLMVYGARQVGKSYILEEFCKNEYDNYVMIDLKKQETYKILFESKKDFENIFEEFKLRLSNEIDIESPNSIIFFDEIQLCPNLIAYLKYFCEDHNNINIICAGSLLGTMLSREEVFVPTGKVWELTMYPMNFEEFLIALNKEAYVTKIRNCYTKNQKMGEFLHDELINLYKIYTYVGGMPESILSFINSDCKLSNYDDNILKGIIRKYMEDMNQYVKNNTETLKIKEVYENIANQLGNTSNKFQPAKINKNRRMDDYLTAINWLYTSKLILRCYLVSLPEEPIKVYSNTDTFKLFTSDCGLLAQLTNLQKSNLFDDKNRIFKGIIAENYVATQLIFNDILLYYWLSGNEAEIDFIVELKDGVIPIEVKSGNNKKAKSLKTYMEKYNPEYGIRVSLGDFSYDARTKIKEIPLYAVFCIKY